MERSDLVLGVMAAGDGASHSPVQVQKLFFLLDRRVGKALGGPFFEFQPYFYGPFDRLVYSELEALALEGHLEIKAETSRKSYRLTASGQRKGEKVLAQLEPNVVSFIKKLSSAVRQMSFAELVSAVYRAYPEMKENSVFQVTE